MTLLPPDPIASLSAEDQQIRGSLWWGHSSQKYAREATELPADGHLAKLLGAGEWEDTQPFSKSTARSLMAWRGLWVKPNLALIEKAIDLGLAPDPSLPMDWWAREYFRRNALRSVFMPERPLPYYAKESERQAFAEREAIRPRVAEKLHQRYPGLLPLMIPPGPWTGSIFGHPLLITARHGMEDDFFRILSIAGPYVFKGSAEEEAPFSPVQMLELGLKRRFSPLIDMAVSQGATVDMPVFDFRGRERSLLHAAIATADEQMIDWVLAQGPRLEVWDRFARTPFLAASRMGDVATMKKLHAAGANIHATDRFGQTAMHLVVEGLSTTVLDPVATRQANQPQYVPKTHAQLDETFVRVGQALAFLSTHGLDRDAGCLPAVKNTKKNPSPFAGLPRAQRQPSTAKAGETPEAQLERRCQEEPTLGAPALARISEARLDAGLMALVPPEAEEEGVEPASEGVLPGVSRRPRM